MVRWTDPVVRVTQLNQLLFYPINEFSALIRHHNFHHSVPGDQVVLEIRPPRGPIYICLLERVKFKPSLNLSQASLKKNFAIFCKKKKKKKNSFGFVRVAANFWNLSQAIRKKNHLTELPLEGTFRAPIQKRTCWITVLDILTVNAVNNYKITRGR